MYNKIINGKKCALIQNLNSLLGKYLDYPSKYVLNLNFILVLSESQQIQIHYFNTYAPHNLGIISIVWTFIECFKSCRSHFDSGFCVIYMHFAKCNAFDLFIDIFNVFHSISQSSHCQDIPFLFSLIDFERDNIRHLMSRS